MVKATVLLLLPLLVAAEWWKDEYKEPVVCGDCEFDVGESGELTVQADCTVKASCRNLSIMYKDITTVPADSFKNHGLEATVRRISFASNKIDELPEGLFDGLTLLFSIVMRENLLKSVPENLLQELPALELFQFGYNLILEVPEGLFDGVDTLLTVDLQGNYITTLPPNLLKGLSVLQLAALGKNRITAVPEGFFHENTDLTTINLSYNELESLPKSTFNNLGKLQEILLRGNKFTKLPLGLFRDTAALTHLHLDNNELTTLPAGLFDSCPALDHISLTHNKITSFPDGLFESVPSLTWLDITDNMLTSLPVNMFSTQVWDGVIMLENPFKCKVDFTADTKNVPAGYDDLPDCPLAPAEGCEAILKGGLCLQVPECAFVDGFCITAECTDYTRSGRCKKAGCLYMDGKCQDPIPGCAILSKMACNADPDCEYLKGTCYDAGTLTCEDYNGMGKRCQAAGCVFERKSKLCSDPLR